MSRMNPHQDPQNKVRREAPRGPHVMTELIHIPRSPPPEGEVALCQSSHLRGDVDLLWLRPTFRNLRVGAARRRVGWVGGARHPLIPDVCANLGEHVVDGVHQTSLALMSFAEAPFTRAAFAPSLSTKTISGLDEMNLVQMCEAMSTGRISN